MYSFLIRLFQGYLSINALLLLPLLIFGGFFSLLKRISYEQIHRSVGHTGIVVLGIAGIPLHEFSHWIFCVLFHHSVQEVRLLRPVASRRDQILGYVKHSYDSNSLFQTIGCFFIGIAPMVSGSILIVLALCFGLEATPYHMAALPDLSTWLQPDSWQPFLGSLYHLLTLLWTPKTVSVWQFWIVIYLIISIALHMTISRADLGSAKKGLGILQLILFLICLLCTAVPVLQSAWLAAIRTASAWLLTALVVAAVIFLLVTMITMVIGRIFRR